MAFVVRFCFVFSWRGGGALVSSTVREVPARVCDGAAASEAAIISFFFFSKSKGGLHCFL